MNTKISRKGESPIPATKRMAALRERRRAAGLTQMEVWAHPGDHKAIREEAARLAKARDEAAKTTVQDHAPEQAPAQSIIETVNDPEPLLQNHLLALHSETVN